MLIPTPWYKYQDELPHPFQYFSFRTRSCHIQVLQTFTVCTCVAPSQYICSMISSNLLPTSNIRQFSFIVIGFLILTYVGNAVRVWYRLRHFKGPISVAFSKFWLIRSHVQQRVYLDVGEVCEKYGEQKLKGFLCVTLTA